MWLLKNSETSVESSGLTSVSSPWSMTVLHLTFLTGRVGVSPAAGPGAPGGVDGGAADAPAGCSGSMAGAPWRCLATRHIMANWIVSTAVSSRSAPSPRGIRSALKVRLKTSTGSSPNTMTDSTVPKAALNALHTS
eukprot:6039768-Lingulodinium_polyedra.AAC.1